MTTRKQFIGAISKTLGRAKPPATLAPFTWRHSVHTDVMKDCTPEDLARLFTEYSRTIGAGVFETDRAGLNDTIRTALGECGSGPIIVANDPLLNELHTAAALETDRTVRVWNTGDSRENNIRFAEKAAVGIAVAKMALSESATVLILSHDGCGRSVTTLPESVIYVIPKSCIRPRLTQGMEFLRRCREQLPSSANFVSGPSATSDIELVRVVGVHGPVHVVHIVVNDM
jgi:L-lactate dehydrogenase complex protein LldG